MTRPSFHSLMPHRRHALTIAINRLMNTPSRLGLNASLYDDFTYIHIQLKNTVHHSAISLPWHRLFIHVFENALRKEGHYDGYLPYWDWTLDAEDPLNSPIWGDRTGFGGNGTDPDNCVKDGILGTYTAKYNEWEYDEHCVKRKFEDSVEDGMMHGKQWGKEVVKDIVKGSKTYGEFRERLESGPHKHLHLGIGGEMFGIGSTNGKLMQVMGCNTNSNLRQIRYSLCIMLRSIDFGGFGSSRIFLREITSTLVHGLRSQIYRWKKRASRTKF